MASDSQNQIIQRPSSENAKKSLINLFSKQSECSYVSCYWQERLIRLNERARCIHKRHRFKLVLFCLRSGDMEITAVFRQECEENVHKLAQDVISRHPNEINKCYVVFISNPSRTVPLWRQRAGKDEDRLVIWDYHVIFLYHPEPEKCLVYDLDSELPFPTYVHKYITETFRTDHILKPDYFRYFRVIPANEFLKEFASDRRHMKRSDGSWIKPPPNYPAIQTTKNDHNLEDYIQMDTSKGPGQVLNLTQFVQRFYKPAT